ncbi:hypothetical protein DMX11_24730 [Pseudomonas sp. LB-090624]|uniref:hypothetical protein n=1 Tax=Pseudomonas TaxID=286 RepID=UPI000D92A1B7|nr:MULTISPECIES: hypothetical protein [unclassified Pseudomonas]MCX2887907.1 hypothetical protein [Pseudomonas sp. DCB_BI]MDH4553272.1 hypothetical protein [Pseudomonas sp. BN607]PYB69409.1 hypothetical protein DMX11_24730 [Pseudomonas sp. LB-090624]
MDSEAFKAFVEEQINRAAQKIIDKGRCYDEHSHGKLSYLLSLRRVINCEATAEDMGLHDAINDIHQALGIIPHDITSFSYIK